MTLTTESTLTLAVCMPLLTGYVCRLGKSSWWTVRPMPLLFHLFGACTVLTAMYQAATTGALGIGWFAVGMAGVWLPWSYVTWADGVPEHAQTQPAPLQVMEGQRQPVPMVSPMLLWEQLKAAVKRWATVAREWLNR